MVEFHNFLIKQNYIINVNIPITYEEEFIFSATQTKAKFIVFELDNIDCTTIKLGDDFKTNISKLSNWLYELIVYFQYDKNKNYLFLSMNKLGVIKNNESLKNLGFIFNVNKNILKYRCLVNL